MAKLKQPRAPPTTIQAPRVLLVQPVPQQPALQVLQPAAAQQGLQAKCWRLCDECFCAGQPASVDCHH
eukprot:1161765-Pelagomonas_calceolata.AAC.10